MFAFQKGLLVFVSEHIMEVQGQFLASAMIWMVWFVTEGSY
jgi:hypothetical protein